MKPSTNRVRQAEAGDAPRIAEINVFAWRLAYRGIVADEFLFKNLSVATRVEPLVRSITGGTERFAVYDDGLVKGFSRAGISRDEELPGWWELYALYIEPAFQRQGIGQALMQHFEQTVWDQGGRQCLLWVFEENRPSRAFYEACGYRADGKAVPYADFGAQAVRYVRTLPKPVSSTTV